MKHNTNLILFSGIFFSLSTICSQEVELVTYTSDAPYASLDMVTFFIHGLGGSKETVTRYLPKKERNSWRSIITTGQAITFQFKDSLGRDVIDYRYSNLAQNLDLATAHAAYESFAKLHLPKKIIIVARSRGASTALRLLARLNAHLAPVAAILESPFACIQDIIYDKVSRLPILGNFASTLTPWIHYLYVPFIHKNYDPEGPQPIESLLAIPKDIPLLFICSQEDRLVPAQSTIKCYQALRKAGYEHVYLLILPQGNHACLLSCINGHIYEQAAHAFYAHYKLPHDSAKAEAGKYLLNSMQPTEQDLIKFLK